jgi:hypothetical protein
MHHFGKMFRAWSPTSETVISDLLEGQYANPVKLVGFSTAEGWARDVSEESPTNSDVAATCR